MLTQILVNNFKAHAETKIAVRPITLFIGPNNSGKSSLSQALLLLRQAPPGGTGFSKTAQRKPTSPQDPYLYPEDHLIDLGEFEDIVRRGQHDVSIGVEGNIGFLGPTVPPGRLQVQFEMTFKDDQLFFHQGIIRHSAPLSEQKAEVQWQWAAGSHYQSILQVKYLNTTLQINAVGNFQLLTPGGISFAPNTSPQLVGDIQLVQRRLAGAPKLLLNSLHPIYPLRGLEERGSPLTELPARNLERLSVADRTVALLSMLAYDLDLQEKVSDWLENLIERRIKVPLLPGKRVTLLSVPPRQKGADSLFTNEGTGTNQLPFILVPIGITPPGETILLTEPEAHLHPKLQSTLISLLLDLSHKEDRQFVIETHSEHVLHSVLYAVSRGELSTSDLAIYYFEMKNEIAECRKLEVTGSGQVEGGLPGFFEQSLSELSDYLDAMKKH